MRDLLYGSQGHHHNDGGTVRIGNYALRPVQRIFRVHFRHHERHLRVHTECTGIIYHHCAELGNVGGKFLRGAASRRHEGYVDVAKVVVMLKFLNDILFPAEDTGRTGTAARAEKI